LAVSFFNNQEEVKIYQIKRVPQGARVVWWVVIVSNQKVSFVIVPSMVGSRAMRQTQDALSYDRLWL
jgi:hypothetical protein